MSTIIKRCRDEKKRGTRVIDGFRKKLMVLNSEISVCPEFEIKSKIGIIFVNENVLEEYSVKIYKIDPYFYENYKEKIQVHKKGCEYILFLKYFLAVEIDEKGHPDRDLTYF